MGGYFFNGNWHGVSSVSLNQPTQCFYYKLITLKFYTYAISCLLWNSLGKGKKDDDAKEDAPVGGDSIIPTLPDVKMCAAKAIARSARSGESPLSSWLVQIFLCAYSS